MAAGRRSYRHRQNVKRPSQTLGTPGFTKRTPRKLRCRRRTCLSPCWHCDPQQLHGRSRSPSGQQSRPAPRQKVRRDSDCELQSRGQVQMLVTQAGESVTRLAVILIAALTAAEPRQLVAADAASCDFFTAIRGLTPHGYRLPPLTRLLTRCRQKTDNGLGRSVQSRQGSEFVIAWERFGISI